MSFIIATRTWILLSLTLLLVGCGGGGGDSDTGAGATTTNPAIVGCTGAQLAGTFALVLTAVGQTASDTVSFEESDFGTTAIQSFSGTEDGVTLNITFDSSCNSFSGTFSEASSGLSGQVSGTRI